MVDYNAYHLTNVTIFHREWLEKHLLHWQLKYSCWLVKPKHDYDVMYVSTEFLKMHFIMGTKADTFILKY